MPDFPFDAVLFDLDGTLVATDRFWPDAARAGALRAFRELGIEREVPTRADWMGLVGLELAQGFDALFADLDPGSRRRVMDLCIEEEEQALRAGQAALLPGVREALSELRERGVRLGIASNCSQSYLDAMMGDLNLAQWIEEGRCVHSRGVHDKSDMIEDLLQTFDTRSAVFVGDRVGDRDAAWANGLPHVHLARGYAQLGERVDCEAVLDGLDELLPRLFARHVWLDATLERLALPPAARIVGITGRPAAGKTLFARDLVRRVEHRGGKAFALGTDRYERRTTLIAEVLVPHAEGRPVDLVPLALDALLVLEGPFLADPEIRPHLERLVHLRVSDPVIARRVAGREGRLGGAAAMEPVFSRDLPAHEAFDTAHPPVEVADVLLDADSVLGP